MAWSTRHVFVYQEVPTAANLNNNFANIDETSPAKVTTKGDMTAATGANAIARVAGTTVRFWSPMSDSAASSGVKFYPQPVMIDHQASSTTVLNTITETDVWSKTLTAGVPGAREELSIQGWMIYTNNSGSNRTYTLKFYIGTTAYTLTSGSISSLAAARPLEYKITVKNLDSTAIQFVIMGSQIYPDSGTSGSGSEQATYGTGTDNFATAKTIKMSVTHSAGSPNISMVSYDPLILLYPGMT